MLPTDDVGPIRSVPWSSLRAGEWDTRTFSISTAAPALRAALAALDSEMAPVRRHEDLTGADGQRHAHAKLVVSDWQQDLKKVSLRIFWQPMGETERVLERSTFVHAARGGPPWRRHSARDIEDGAAVYAAACAGCHGVAGRGVPGVAPPLDDPAALARRMAEADAEGGPAAAVEAVIARGRSPSGEPYSLAMPAWSEEHGGSLSREAVRNVVAYVLNWHGGAGESATETAPADPPASEGSPAAIGAALYGASDCLGCHGWPGEGGITGPDLAGFGRRGTEQLPGVDVEGALRVALLAPSAFVPAECPTGPCADMMPRDYGDRLSQRDIELLVRFILSVNDVAPRARRPGAPPPLVGGLAEVTTTVPRSEPSPARGKVLYDDHCAMCHGDAGQGGMGSAMTTVLRSVDAVAYARAATAQGVPGLMPAWDQSAGGPFTASDLDDVAAYMVVLARR